MKTTGARYRVNMISAVSAQGALKFALTEGNVDAEVFIDFCQRLQHDHGDRPVFLVVDGHPSHRAKKTEEWVKSTNGLVHLRLREAAGSPMAPSDLDVSRDADPDATAPVEHFRPLPSRMVMVEGTPAATIMDSTILNVPTFGMCTSLSNPEVAAATAAALGVLAPMPCVPMLTPWTPGSPTTLIGDEPALVAGSQCQCAYGHGGSWRSCSPAAPGRSKRSSTPALWRLLCRDYDLLRRGARQCHQANGRAVSSR